MANLLLDPQLWIDSGGTPPPESWDGSAYTKSWGAGVYSSFMINLDEPTSAASTVSGTITITTNDELVTALTLYLQNVFGDTFDSASIPVGVPTAFEFEAPADETLSLFTASSYDTAVVITPTAEPYVDGTNCDCDCGYPTKTLAEMRQEMLIAMGYAAQLAAPAASVVLLANWHLNNAQRIAAQDLVEINSVRYFTWDVAAGQTKFCTTDNIETCRNVLAATRITEAWIVRDDNQRDRLIKGISFGMAANDNPRSTPVRYDVRSCIEIWPPPDRAMRLVVKGSLAAVDMVEDTDTPTVDPQLVLTRAIAFYKAGKGHQDAQIYMGQYNQYLSGLNKESFSDRRWNTGDCRRSERLTHVMEPRIYDDGSTE